MMKIAICDNEIAFQHTLQKHIKQYMTQKHIAYEMNLFSAGEELISLGNNLLHYDIIFLDVNMRAIDGIETAEIIRKYNKDVFLVFVTAHISYSLEGYRVNATRYLLKDNYNFKEAISECLNTIIQKISTTKVKLSFDFTEGARLISVENIIFIESHLHKSKFHVSENNPTTYSMYIKLNQLEDKLAHHNFLRIHQSYLVNMKYIAEIKNYTVILYTGMELPIPKPKYRSIKSKFIAYKGEF